MLVYNPRNNYNKILSVVFIGGVILLFSITRAFGGDPTLKNSQYHNVSIINLIATAEKYQGKQVRLIGYVVLGFENKSIFISDVHAKHSILSNALWMDIELNENNRIFDNRYCIVEGVFDSLSRGHLNMYSGTITDIKRIDKWEE